MKKYVLFLIVLSICPIWAGAQQYNIIRQGVCWTTPLAVDSSLTRLVYVSVSGAGPISVNYVNAAGSSVDVSGGGDFEMGYCGCCPVVDSNAIDILYYTDGDSILNRDTILYKNYYSHVFLSGNGNNFTGRIGNFNRPFSSPWEAQDLFPDSNNLSLIAYQGDYIFPVSQFKELNTADTFFLTAIGGSNFRYGNVTGEPSLTGMITDAPAGVDAIKKISYINAQDSRFSFVDTGIKMLVANYNPGTYTKLVANNAKITGGRSWLIQSAGSLDAEIDSVHVDGDILISLTGDYTNAALDTISGKTNIKIGSATVAGLNAASSTGTIRVQSDDSYIGAVSNISIDDYTIEGDDGGMLISFTRGEFKNSIFGVSIGNYKQETNSSASAMFEIGSLNSTMFNDAELLFCVDNAEISQPILDQGFNTGLTLNNRSVLDIKLGNVKINYVGSQPIFNIENIVLNDSSIVRIHCDYCESTGGGQVFFDVTGCDIPQGAIIEISGTYVAKSRSGEMVSIGANTDLSGLILKDAVFINNGVAEWIEATSAQSIAVENAWSNSSVTVNVDLVGRDFWGFYNCDSDYVTMQEILDAFCDSLAAIPEDLNVAEDDLTANGSHTTDWLDHTIEFDFTGAPLDTIVYRWPSPDGEVQGLYIGDGAQEMALLMNDVRGTDFANIINYNLADEIVFGNTGDTVTVQADKLFLDVQNMVRADTVTSVLIIDSDREVKLKYVPISGRVSDTTDGSGDIVIPLGVTMSSVNFTALVGARGTTFQQAQVISNTAVDITVRVLDDSGAPITGTAVVVDWMVMDY